MKNDTFDIPAYKFCILRDIDQNDMENLDEKNQRYIFNERQMVPFENVDGLTISEIQNLLNAELIVCACYIDGGMSQWYKRESKKIRKSKILIRK